MASPKQVKYIEDLLIDAGFVDRINRNAWLSEEVGRQIKFVDDLKPDECTIVIRALKELGDDRWEEKAKKRQDDRD